MFTLFQDQEVFVGDIRTSLMTYNRTLAVAPTGFGKTVAFSYMVSRARERGRRVGLFCHRAELLDQISGALREFRVPHGIIAAGSSVDLRHTVHVISAQTYARRVDKMPKYNLNFIDEAHHCTDGSTWGKCMAHNAGAKWVGVTATPERLDGRGLRESFDDLVLGPSVRDLIDMGRLSDYRLFAPSTIDTTGMRSLGGDFNRGELSEAADKPSITGDVIQHYRKHLAGAPSAAFCVSIAHAHHVAEQFREAGYVAAHIDGKMEGGMRRQIVRDFRDGKINVLTSADLLSEGFDAPGMHGAMLLRPTKSLALCLQQIGRALRKCQGKDKATILDHAGNTANDRHGLPCADREWSLDGRKKGAALPEASMTKECSVCFARIALWRTKCSECDATMPVRPRKIEEVAGELQEVDKEVIRKQVSPERLEQGRAKTLKELEELAEKRGYKKTWAIHIFNARQAKRARV